MRFGPNWPGRRCEAKTRKGTPCQRLAKLPVGRCSLHGGASTGPRNVSTVDKFFIIDGFTVFAKLLILLDFR